VRGRVQSNWQRQGNGLVLEVEVPVGAEAEVHVPTAGGGNVRESGVSAAEAPGVKYVGQSARDRVYRIGSGIYRFSSGQE